RRKEQEKKEEKRARKKQEKTAQPVELESSLEDVPGAPEMQQGTYSDGHPLDEVHYLECKLILKAERFTSVRSFRQFADFVRRASDASGVDFDTSSCAGVLPQIREVLFLDTPGFQLYNNAFILRRRTLFENGFPVG